MIYMTGLDLASNSSEISWKTTCVSKPTVEPLLGAQPLIEVPISAFLLFLPLLPFLSDLYPFLQAWLFNRGWTVFIRHFQV